MNADSCRNLAASVSRRLLNAARASNDDFQLVLVRYGLERLMYRLSQSSYAHLFTVKGALMFLVWAGEQYRPTKDLDLMSSERQTTEELTAIFRSLCSMVVESDGKQRLQRSSRLWCDEVWATVA